MNTFQKILALQTRIQNQINKKSYVAATENQLDALELAQLLDKPKLTAILYTNLGKILEKRGAIQKMVYAYEAAFKALKKEDHQLEVTSRRLRMARKSYKEDREINIPDIYSPDIATSIKTALEEEDLNLKILINIGNSYLLQPQPTPALNAYEQVLKQRNINKFPLLKAQTIVKIGEIFRQQQKTTLALKKSKEAIDLLTTLGLESDKRFAYTLKARLLFQAGHIQQALPFYQKALELFEQEKDFSNAGKVLAQMGQLFLGENKFKQAEKHYLKAHEYTRNSGMSDYDWHLYWGLGCCYRKAQKWEKAATFFEKSSTRILKRQNRLYTDEGKVAFLESVRDVFESLIETYLKIETPEALEKAFAIADKAKGQSLSDLMKGRSRRRASTSQSLNTFSSDNLPESNFNPIRQMSSGVPTLAPETDEFSSEELKRVMDAFTDEEKEGATSTEEISIPATNALPDFIFSGLNESKSLELPEKRPISQRHYLCFYSLDDRLLTWLKNPVGKYSLHIWQISRKQLIEKIKLFRSAMTQQAQNRGIVISRNIVPIDSETESRSVISRKNEATSVELAKISRELYQQLIYPFQHTLANEVRTLVFIPHDFLWLLPFAALKNENGQALGAQFALMYAPSIKILQQIDEEPPYSNLESAEALIIGNPKMSQAHKKYHFKPLNGAEREAKTLGKLFKVKPFVKEAATKKMVRKKVATANILHLATHGMTDEIDPLDSFIVLADHYLPDGTLDEAGLLKAREVMFWSIPCELVNLSACQTALGKIAGEGIIGLSRAFLIAGSRSVLVSLWNISDQATAEFMQQFYQFYFESGNKGTALQKTVQHFQNKQKYQHEVFWSGFILVGSDN